MQCNFNSFVIIVEISDHLLIVVDDIQFNEIQSDSYLKRSYSKININSGKNCLSITDWTDVLNCKNTCVAYDIFIYVFFKHFNTCFPLCFINSNKLNLIKPWMSKGLMTSIKQRSLLYKQILCGNLDKAVYTRYRNNLINLIRIAKTQYY